MIDRILRHYGILVKGLEMLLAMVVLGGVVVSAIGSSRALADMDWRTTEAFYELIYRVLLLVIGLEVVRMLVTHELIAVLEVLALVIARKMLKPELLALDIVFAVIAFVALLAARRFLVDGLSREKPKKDTEAKPHCER